MPVGPPPRTVEFGALGSTKRENIRSDQGAAQGDIVIAGANRSLARTESICICNIIIFHLNLII